MRTEFTLQNKFDVLRPYFKDKTGRVLDIGARDRTLAKYLDLSRISYLSCDLMPGHDYNLNLEKPLPLPDNEFDYVVALDVLEHLENIHLAFSELTRITKSVLIVALPNMATLARRLSFLLEGSLKTGKYDLLPKHQGDRHRWLTIHPQMKKFIEENAQLAGFKLERTVEEIESGRRPYRWLGLVLARMGMPVTRLASARTIYFLRKN